MTQCNLANAEAIANVLPEAVLQGKLLAFIMEHRPILFLILLRLNKILPSDISESMYFDLVSNACQDQQMDLLETLLKANYYPNAANKLFVLQASIKYDNVEILSLFCNVNFQWDGHSINAGCRKWLRYQCQ